MPAPEDSPVLDEDDFSIPLFDDDAEGAHSSPLASGGWARLAAAESPPSQPALPQAPLDLPTEPDSANSLDLVDWGVVAKLRQAAAQQLSEQIAGRDGLEEETRREIGRGIITQLVADAARTEDKDGRVRTFEYAEQQQIRQAIYDALFGLGRFQPLVDDPMVENIEVYGHDRVFLVYADGTIRRGPAVADSDEQLIKDLQFFAARSGAGERPFSPANPNLDLKLPGNHRLSANAWVSPQPNVVIRRHRLVKITLEELVDRDMLTQSQADFLQACVRAKMSIVVSGPQGGGKTTMVRALALCTNPWEAIATIETEYELLLHELGTHERVMAFEARPGSGERDQHGHRAGEVTLDDLTYASFRKNRSRTILGEVRGSEILPLLEVMQSGAGSLSTVHASNARGAVHRLVGLATKAGGHLSQYAASQIAAHIDVVVQIGLEDNIEPTEDPETGKIVGTRTRYVSEVVLVEPGEGVGGFAFTDVYKRGWDGRAQPGILPGDLAEVLAKFGFHDDSLKRREKDDR